MKTLSRTLACLLALSTGAWAQQGEQTEQQDHEKLHMELKKDAAAPAGSCGKLTFKDSKKKMEGDKEEVEYKTLKHSKLDDLDVDCVKKQLVKKQLIEKEADYDALNAKNKKLAKKLAILDKGDEEVEKELSKDIDEAIKKKLRGAKKKLAKEKTKARSKCKPDSGLKC